MPTVSFLSDILVFLIAAVVVAPVFQRLRAGLTLGYFVAGVIIGPHALGLVRDTEGSHAVAELGVLFLLFAIGLELSIKRLRVIRGFVLGLGTAQVAITGLVFGSIAVAAGMPVQTAIVVGGGLALSSTAVVVQLLSERREMATRVGRVAFAILLLQDLAVVPLLALVPSLAEPAGALGWTVLLTLSKAVLALAVIFAVGRLVLKPLFRAVSLGRNTDLFAATTLLVLLGTSWLTASMGLSLAMGGFIAGLLLSETEYRHQVGADIAPFRGLLLGLFFMTVGMGLDLSVVAGDPAYVAMVVIIVVAVKAVLIAGLCRIAGQPWPISVNTGLLLAQGGEFAFVLLGVAGAAGIVPLDIGSKLIAGVAVTMALTPALAAAGRKLGDRMRRAGAATLDEITGESEALKDHVILAGFGRVGRSVATTLIAAEIPYVAVELDPSRVAEAGRLGRPVFYGDASRPDVMRALGADRARTAVVTMDDVERSERTVHLLHSLFPALHIMVRARDDAHRRRLVAAGADGIVHETVEMSLNLGAATLRSFGISDEEVQEIILAHRAEDYALLSETVEEQGEGP